jgi:succinoglycan biosynthesis transport protein ExoP
MEEEIDLRQYINVLIRRWYWIAGLALAAAVVALAVSFLLPPTYEATSLVIVTQPRYLFQFDQRVENLPFDAGELARGYQTIATSDDMLLSIAKSANPPLPPEMENIEELKKMFVAETGGDVTMVGLTVRFRDPQQAAGLANAWAEQLAAYLNRVYGRSNDSPLFEKQMMEAKTALDQADLALATFRRKYGLGFSGSSNLALSDVSDAQQMNLDLGIVRQLRAKTDLLTQYETQADRTTRLLQEARTVAARADSTTSPAIVAGLLSDMINLGLMDKESSSLVQINLSGLDARASLSALITALEAKQSSADEAVTRLKGEVSALQSELADRQGELDQLLRDRQVAQDTYLTLSNKSQEAGIQAQDNTGDVARVGSRAAVPKEPASPRKLLNTVVAGALGLMAGVFGAFFIEYWRQGAPAAAARVAQ